LTTQKLLSVAENNNIKIKTSSGNEIDYKIGDESFTNICDYMENCEFCGTTYLGRTAKVNLKKSKF
jgi:hypothetical protein